MQKNVQKRIKKKKYGTKYKAGKKISIKRNLQSYIEKNGRRYHAE